MKDKINSVTRSESDIAWKEILDFYFKDFVDYCLPQLSNLINWKRKWISLDKELQVVTKGTESGKVKVFWINYLRCILKVAKNNGF